MRKSASYLGGLAVVLALLAPARARAQGGDAAAAEALFDQGRTAMDAKDYDTACAKFRESQRLDPAPGTMLNLAACEEARGNLATAWQLFRGAADKLAPDDSRVGVANDRAAKLKPRLPMLTIELTQDAPDGTTVERDGTPLGSASLGVPLPVDPGKHKVTVKSPGQSPKSYDISIAEAETKTLAVAPSGGGGERDISGSARADSASNSQLFGYVFGGIGVAGIAVGTVTGLMANGKKSTVDEHCDADKFCDQTGLDAADSGKTLSAISTGGFIVGALGLGAGAYFLLFADSGGKSDTGVATRFGPRGTSVSLVHHW